MYIVVLSRTVTRILAGLYKPRRERSSQVKPPSFPFTSLDAAANCVLQRINDEKQNCLQRANSVMASTRIADVETQVVWSECCVILYRHSASRTSR